MKNREQVGTGWQVQGRSPFFPCFVIQGLTPRLSVVPFFLPPILPRWTLRRGPSPAILSPPAPRDHFKSVLVFLLAGMLLGGAVAPCGSGAWEGRQARPRDFYGNGPTDRKFITLTFDDGPGRETLRVLAILARYKVQATFFMEGSQVDRYPEIAKQVVTAGHEVGNHSYTHVNFYRYKKPDARTRLREELHKAAAAIQRATGVHPVLLRMPHGYFRPWVREVTRAEGYTVVHWSFGCDWKPMPAETMAQAYIAHARPGAIFLFHDGGKSRQRTIEALPIILDTLQRAGYTFGPIRAWLRPLPSVRSGDQTQRLRNLFHGELVKRVSKPARQG